MEVSVTRSLRSVGLIAKRGSSNNFGASLCLKALTHALISLIPRAITLELLQLMGAEGKVTTLAPHNSPHMLLLSYIIYLPPPRWNLRTLTVH